MAIDSRTAPLNASPLWVIALFIVLCEVVAGLAIALGDGITKITFTIFAATFPVVVIAVFSWLLVRHTDKLYSPNQYRDTGLDPSSFRTRRAEVQQRTSEARKAVFEGAVADAIEETVTTESLDSDSAEFLRQRLVDDVRRNVRANTLSVDLSVLEPHSGHLEVPISVDTTVQDLLDTVYFSTADHVDAYRYNESWVLETEARVRLTDIETQWSAESGFEPDTRPVDALGVEPGSTLTVIPIPSRTKRTARRPPIGSNSSPT